MATVLPLSAKNRRNVGVSWTKEPLTSSKVLVDQGLSEEGRSLTTTGFLVPAVYFLGGWSVSEGSERLQTQMKWLRWNS